MTRIFSYIVKYDTGFAPNPFHGYCTLATCKPGIRRTAKVGDWIVGTGSKSRRRDGLLVYVMHITEAMSFDEYWKDPRFQDKKPAENTGSEKCCGDNIYYIDSNTNRLCQVKGSYHNDCDITHDTKADRVLISDDFIYWGSDGPPLPEFSGVSLVSRTQGHKCRFPQEVVENFEHWIQGLGDKGLFGNPTEWQRPSPLPRTHGRFVCNKSRKG